MTQTKKGKSPSYPNYHHLKERDNSNEQIKKTMSTTTNNQAYLQGFGFSQNMLNNPISLLAVSKKNSKKNLPKLSSSKANMDVSGYSKAGFIATNGISDYSKKNDQQQIKGLQFDRMNGVIFGSNSSVNSNNNAKT